MPYPQNYVLYFMDISSIFMVNFAYLWFLPEGGHENLTSPKDWTPPHLQSHVLRAPTYSFANPSAEDQDTSDV